MSKSFLKPGERRRQILEAALECFSGKGYAPSTIDDIRQLSGASTGSIYHHFGGKEQLAAALYLEGLRDYQSSLLNVIERFPTAEALIKGIVLHYIEWVTANPDWARFLLEMRRAESVASAEEEIRATTRRFFQQLERHFRPFVEGGEMNALPEELYAPLITGPTQELARHWLAGRDPEGLIKARDYLAEAAWRALRPEPVPASAPSSAPASDKPPTTIDSTESHAPDASVSSHRPKTAAPRHSPTPNTSAADSPANGSRKGSRK